MWMTAFLLMAIISVLGCRQAKEDCLWGCFAEEGMKANGEAKKSRLLFNWQGAFLRAHLGKVFHFVNVQNFIGVGVYLHVGS